MRAATCPVMDGPLPEDIWIEILVRIPVYFLFHLKSVSKSWRNTLSRRDFRLRYLQHSAMQNSQLAATDDDDDDDDLASSLQRFIQSSQEDDGSLSSFLGFIQSAEHHAFLRSHVMVDHEYSTKFYNFSSTAAPQSKMHGALRIASSGGLVLYYDSKYLGYYITHPLTKKWLSLPRSPNFHFDVVVGFDVEPIHGVDCDLKHFSFKLVCIVLENLTYPHDRLHLEIYSAQTKGWTRESIDLLGHTGILFRPFECATVIKGVHYWQDQRRRIFSYNTNVNRDFIFKLIDMPVVAFPRSCILGQSIDGSLLCATSTNSKIVTSVLKTRVTDRGIRKCHWEEVATISCKHIPALMSLAGFWYRREEVDVTELIAFHPWMPSIVFLRSDDLIISCCFLKRQVRVLQLQNMDANAIGNKSQKSPPQDMVNRLFPYFAPQWACLLL